MTKSIRTFKTQWRTTHVVAFLNHPALLNWTQHGKIGVRAFMNSPQIKKKKTGLRTGSNGKRIPDTYLMWPKYLSQLGPCGDKAPRLSLAVIHRLRWIHESEALPYITCPPPNGLRVSLAKSHAAVCYATAHSHFELCVEGYGPSWHLWNISLADLSYCLSWGD